jgi:caffeoyl-CoA O-methyltransferase
MPNSPERKSFAAEGAALADYVERTFHPEDEVLADIRKRAAAAGLPAIHVSPFDGLLLEVIARAARAKKIVEVGTLAGLSGVCLARALPDVPGGEGVLHTFEFEPKHAQVARESFRKAGIEKKIAIHVGAALANLPKIEKDGPFDLVFIDADKENYPNYLAWAAKHLRAGGVVLCDNAFAWGLVAVGDDAPELKEGHNATARKAIRATNAALADPRGPWRGMMIPTGEGLAMGVKKV